MTGALLGRLLPAGAIAALAAAVAWISFTQEPAGAFLFPRLISVFFVLLSLWNLGLAARGQGGEGRGFTPAAARAILPGVAVALVYGFWAAKALGFYLSSALAIFLLLAIYSPLPRFSPRTWAMHALVTGAAIAVLYALFALLIQVQTPRGILA